MTVMSMLLISVFGSMATQCIYTQQDAQAFQWTYSNQVDPIIAGINPVPYPERRAAAPARVQLPVLPRAKRPRKRVTAARDDIDCSEPPRLRARLMNGRTSPDASDTGSGSLSDEAVTLCAVDEALPVSLDDRSEESTRLTIATREQLEQKRLTTARDSSRKRLTDARAAVRLPESSDEPRPVNESVEPLPNKSNVDDTRSSGSIFNVSRPLFILIVCAILLGPILGILVLWRSKSGDKQSNSKKEFTAEVVECNDLQNVELANP